MGSQEKQNKGIRHTSGLTFIELIIFILVGGLFVPFAYLAFTGVMREATNPDAYVKARFIAEAKMEDITRNTFVNLPASSPAYTNVNADSRYTDASYNNYQWRWVITDIAYSDNALHDTTTISAPPVWAAGSYKVGDYVLQGAQYYRADFSVWASGTTYSVNDYVLPPPQTPGSPYYNNFVYQYVSPGPTGVSDTNPDIIGKNVAAGTVFCEKDGSTTLPCPSDGVAWRKVAITTSVALSSTLVPSGAGIDEPGKIRWIASNAYKQIAVYVTPPRCSSDTCAYTVSTIVTSRTVP